MFKKELMDFWRMEVPTGEEEITRFDLMEFEMEIENVESHDMSIAH